MSAKFPRGGGGSRTFFSSKSTGCVCFFFFAFFLRFEHVYPECLYILTFVILNIFFNTRYLSMELIINPLYTGGTLGSSDDSDEMQQNVAFHQGLHYSICRDII